MGIKDSGSVVDDAVTRNAWLVYGSRKSEEMEPYRVTNVISSEGKEMDLEEAFCDYELLDYLERPMNIKGKVSSYLPRILSIFHGGRPIMEVKEGLVCPLKATLKNREKKGVNKLPKHLEISVQESLKISARLLPMLHDFRAEKYDEWMRIGWILNNIGKGSTQALEQWITFSSRCEEKFDEATCVYQWEKMMERDITLGTLRHFAKLDSPEEYSKLKNESVKHYAKESLNGSHWDIAMALHAMYCEEFVCAS
ncbi:MAG: hypothetical protein GY861_02085, partial [bacterium]|nr:hypothetical protein [bacterium]